MSCRTAAVSLALVLAAPAVHAQETPNGLAGLLLRFFSPSNPVVLQAAPDPFSHAAHFVSQPNAQETLRQLNRGIASQLSTFPLGSSSSGFTYDFDPDLGVFNRTTETFGPVFAERPLTAGKGKFSFGVNHSAATYDTFESQDLGDGDIKLYLTHEDLGAPGHLATATWFEGDIIQSALSIDLSNDTTVLYANYGVTDRFDIGVALPYVRLDMTARIDATIERLATAADPFEVHVFPDGGSLTESFVESGSAEGIGDMVIRGKYNFYRGAGANVALATDLRLPTGDTDDLLGSGATQVKLYAILGTAGKRFSPRASFGYTFSSGGADFMGELPDEIAYTAGFDAGLHSRVTLTADFVGRTQLDADRLVLQEQTFEAVSRTDATVTTTTHLTPTIVTGNLNVLLGSVGLKVNPVGRLLLVGNVLLAIGEGGLQDEVTPVFGVEYSF
jgi:outer membrane putative beta-barrel porin/alpha-amylase